MSAIQQLQRGEVPLRFDPEKHDRHAWRGYGMWGIVDLTWTKRLADYIGDRRCLEVMAGRGWLSAALRHHGVDVVATGQLSNSYDTLLAKGTVTEVEDLCAMRAVYRYRDNADILIVSWPVADMTMYKVLQLWGEKKPIVFVGEWYSTEIFALSGCASDEFFLSVERDKGVDFGYPRGRQGIDIATVCYKREQPAS